MKLFMLNKKNTEILLPIAAKDFCIGENGFSGFRIFKGLKGGISKNDLFGALCSFAPHFRTGFACLSFLNIRRRGIPHVPGIMDLMKSGSRHPAVAAKGQGMIKNKRLSFFIKDIPVFIDPDRAEN